MTPNEARVLPLEERKAGIVVEGNATPFGGSWTFDPVANTLTLQEPPTAAGTPKQEDKDDAN